MRRATVDRIFPADSNLSAEDLDVRTFRFEHRNPIRNAPFREDPKIGREAAKCRAAVPGKKRGDRALVFASNGSSGWKRTSDRDVELAMTTSSLVTLPF